MSVDHSSQVCTAGEKPVLAKTDILICRGQTFYYGNKTSGQMLYNGIKRREMYTFPDMF